MRQLQTVSGFSTRATKHVRSNSTEARGKHTRRDTHEAVADVLGFATRATKHVDDDISPTVCNM